jgi:transcription elongation GreA/GreB family factor
MARQVINVATGRRLPAEPASADFRHRHRTRPAHCRISPPGLGSAQPQWRSIVSRAFVKEDDGGRPEVLPELPVSAAPNLVTARGLRAIEARIAELEAELAAVPDETRTARLRRDLRYWALRHATARPTAPDPADPTAQFGSRVSYRGEDGAIRTITITGEDEADPAAGRIAYTAPVARALIGATPGTSATVQLRGQPVELEVLAVDVPSDEG